MLEDRQTAHISFSSVEEDIRYFRYSEILRTKILRILTPRGAGNPSPRSTPQVNYFNTK